jgi:hypothetical protein
MTKRCDTSVVETRLRKRVLDSLLEFSEVSVIGCESDCRPRCYAYPGRAIAQILWIAAGRGSVTVTSS